MRKKQLRVLNVDPEVTEHGIQQLEIIREFTLVLSDIADLECVG